MCRYVAFWDEPKQPCQPMDHCHGNRNNNNNIVYHVRLWPKFESLWGSTKGYGDSLKEACLYVLGLSPLVSFIGCTGVTIDLPLARVISNWMQWVAPGLHHPSSRRCSECPEQVGLIISGLGKLSFTPWLRPYIFVLYAPRAKSLFSVRCCPGPCPWQHELGQAQFCVHR